MGDHDEVLSHAEYWDEHYSRPSDGDSPTHEWFRGWADLESFFQRHLFDHVGRRPDDNPLILHLGSGDSVIPAELDNRGYKHQLCVDFSPKVVKMMAERHKNRAGIEWREMDVRNMDSILDKSVDIAFDKGTLDAMIHGSPWSPPDDVTDNVREYLKEVDRTLKDDGVFLYVTFRQPHFMRPLLELQEHFSLELEVLSNKGSFDYYGWVIHKVIPEVVEADNAELDP